MSFNFDETFKSAEALPLGEEKDDVVKTPVDWSVSLIVKAKNLIKKVQEDGTWKDVDLKNLKDNPITLVKSVVPSGQKDEVTTWASCVVRAAGIAKKEEEKSEPEEKLSKFVGTIFGDKTMERMKVMLTNLTFDLIDTTVYKEYDFFDDWPMCQELQVFAGYLLLEEVGANVEIDHVVMNTLVESNSRDNEEYDAPSSLAVLDKYIAGILEGQEDFKNTYGQGEKKKPRFLKSSDMIRTLLLLVYHALTPWKDTNEQLKKLWKIIAKDQNWAAAIQIFGAILFGCDEDTRLGYAKSRGIIRCEKTLANDMAKTALDQKCQLLQLLSTIYLSSIAIENFNEMESPDADSESSTVFHKKICGKFAEGAEGTDIPVSVHIRKMLKYNLFASNFIFYCDKTMKERPQEKKPKIPGEVDKIEDQQARKRARVEGEADVSMSSEVVKELKEHLTSLINQQTTAIGLMLKNWNKAEHKED